MPIVEWNTAFNVNVEEIDSQHMEMLKLVNSLHAAVEACIDKPVLKGLLGELADFTRMHFETEERYMQAHDFPGFLSHHHEHQQLLRHLDELVTAVSDGHTPTFFSDYDISTDWAISHILEHDKALGRFLNSRDIY